MIFVKEEDIMQRPNILLITTDQQRYDTIHAMGYDLSLIHIYGHAKIMTEML